jgi:hypothetical protein
LHLINHIFTSSKRTFISPNHLPHLHHFATFALTPINMPSLSKTLLIALLLTTSALALPTPQLAGEGAALNSVFSSTDNGIGYGTEAAEENLAGNIASILGGTTTTGGSAAPAPAGPPPPGGQGPKGRRQLDKISNGFQAVGNSAGVGDSTKGLTNALDNLDGDLTSGAANLGAQVGSTEENTLIDIGKAVPRI